VSAKQLARTLAIEPVDTMNDQRFGLGEALDQRPGEKQMFGRACPATLA
jgi:hypothetical protein